MVESPWMTGKPVQKIKTIDGYGPMFPLMIKSDLGFQRNIMYEKCMIPVSLAILGKEWIMYL